jgi:hypothetical protein
MGMVNRTVISLAFPIVFLAIIISYARDHKTAAPPRPGTWTAVQDCTEGGEGGDTAQVERDATPATLTWHQFDSLAKHLNIYCMYVGDTTGRYVSREMVMQIHEAQHFRGRDSAFVFQGDNCIRIELRLGTTAADKDTILWINLRPPSTCFDSVTVALGCYDTIKTYVADTQTVRICDTVCTITTQYQSPLKYYQWSSLGMTAMVNLASGGCKKYPAPTSPYYGYEKFVLYNGQWWMLTDTAHFHHFIPAADSCYIPDTEVAYAMFLMGGVFGPNPYLGQGPWYVDSSETITGTVEVPCELYSQPTVTRTVMNCRDTLMTVIREVLTQTWVDAGRDTTIWTDTCDCYIPYFFCTSEPDTVCWTKYIYEYTYTRDSVQCEKEYVIPLYTEYPAWQRTFWQICRGDPEIDTAYARFLTVRNAHATAPRTSATQVHIRTSISGLADTCWSWSCMTDEDIPPVGANDFWIERAELDAFFPCPGPSCEIEEYAQLHKIDWCCEKDTTLVFICEFEDGAPADTVTHVVTIPDRTGPCNQWTYTDWVITDSTLIDSIRICEVQGTRIYYQLAFRDTCCHTPTFNGEPFCNLWLVDDCCGPLYQDESGVWHIPCCDEVDKDGDGLYDGTDYAYVEKGDRYAQSRIDSLFQLSDFTQGAGRVYGGRITDNGDGTVSIGKGLGLAKVETGDIAGSPLDCSTCPDGLAAPVSNTVPVRWDSVAVLHVADSAYSYIYYDYSGDTIATTTDFYSIDFHQDFTLGRVYRMGTRLINRLCGTNVWEFDRRLQLAGEELFPVERATGINVSEGSFRSIQVTAGVVWAELVNRFTTPAIDSRVDSMRSWIRSGTGWRDTMVTAIDSINYDDGTEALQPLTANRYGVHWIYVVHDGTLHHVYGRGDYTLAQAQESGIPTLPGELSAYATLRAKIIIQKSAGVFTSLESPDDVRFTVSAAPDHNDLGGLEGGDGSNYYHLTGDELTDVQSIPTIQGDVTDHETAIDGIRDSLSFAWLDSSYTSSFTPALRGNIVYYLDATGGNIDITLPAAASATGKEYVFKRIGDGGANTVTIKATVDADENPTMAEWQSYRIRLNGSAWYYIE